MFPLLHYFVPVQFDAGVDAEGIVGIGDDIPKALVKVEEGNHVHHNRADKILVFEVRVGLIYEGN